MHLNFLTKDVTKLFFRIAAVLGGAYFFLKIYPPPSFFLYRYPFLDYNEYTWWAPRWLADFSFWGNRGADLGSILLIISLLLATLAFWGLYQQSSGKKAGQSRQLYLLAAISTGLMLLVSAIFGYFNFPYFEIGNQMSTLRGWSILLLVFMVATGIISLVSLSALAYDLAKRRLMTIWVGVALIIGLLIVDLNWLTLLFNSSQLFPLDLLAPVSILLGIGWGIGLWQLGDIVDKKPVEHQWPGIYWKKVGIGVGIYLVVWAVFVAGVYTWDNRNVGALCRGSQDITGLDDTTEQIIQHSSEYSFTYFNTADLVWHGQKYNASPENNGNCSLSTWEAPTWATNVAWSYIPFAANWLYDYDALEPDEPVASFYVQKHDQRFETLDELLADLEQNEEMTQASKEKQSWYPPNITRDTTHSRTTLDGREALLTVNKIGNSHQYNYSRQMTVIEDNQEYQVGWWVMAKSLEDRDEFVAEHRDQLDAMVESFQFK